MSLELVPDPVAQDRSDALSLRIDRLSELVDRAIDGDEIENADSLAKLVNALARLTEARLKAEQVVKPSDLTAFIHGMTVSINAHVTSREAKENIERDWRLLIEEVAG